MVIKICNNLQNHFSILCSIKFKTKLKASWVFIHQWGKKKKDKTLNEDQNKVKLEHWKNNV